MKRILVPTDFSPVADNALQYAIEIAAEFKSEIHLYHMYAFDRFNYDMELPKDKQPYTKEVEHSMERTKLKFSEKIQESGLSIRTFVKEDSIFSLFTTKVMAHGIDIIVMGSKGASGMSKLFFGSVAATSLRMARVPLLVVPPGHSYKQLKHMVLAIDHKETEPHVLSTLQKLALKFEARLTLLHIRTDLKKRSEGVPKIDFGKVKTTLREVPISKSINGTINKFVQKEHCDLLCMVRRKKGLFKNIFHKSMTKVQVFNNQVPLLVLPEV